MLSRLTTNAKTLSSVTNRVAKLSTSLMTTSPVQSRHNQSGYLNINNNNYNNHLTQPTSIVHISSRSYTTSSTSTTTTSTTSTSITTSKNDGDDFPDRLDPKWDHLRSLESLKELADREVIFGSVNNIELPVFPKEYLPYGIDPSDLKDCVLTKERYEIIAKFWNNIKMGEKDVKADMTSIMNGGPGSGKSFTLYLLLSIAYVNGCFVYFSSAKDFIKTSEEDRCNHFIDKLVKFNSGLAAEIPLVTPWIKSLEGNPSNLMELFGCVDPSYRSMDKIMREINQVTSVPIILAIDDYDSMDKVDIKKEPYNNNKRPQEYEIEESGYFFDYFKIKRVPGHRVNLLISGCNGRQMSGRLYHLYNFMEPFKVHPTLLISHPNHAFDNETYLKFSTKLEATLHCVTGGNPGELKLLQKWSERHPAGNPKEYAMERKGYYLNLLNEYWIELKGDDLSYIYFQFLLFTYLHRLFIPDSLENIPSNGPPPMMVNRGLVVQDDKGNYVPSCLAARHAMYHFYFFDLPTKHKSYKKK
ncbi:hypothetical protein SAMD00019534_041680 [Acytostelium subglobosum LB1]|uniref:hypothetical protein n=1 Tax=Acytostelium subglobosum LB1 TaxID=1410327 RepID=UPI000644D86A|nr:hypothetical protein SAMD00019534_041680 [Acytostelium subglobosum LB1]GAM20993.1 hypothetical protein SAMD00019534_041680 [Acytostelium subglobosum LB1]|eukprot:XP_012756127.1 hypothetical protein SAMD00019534_041680 [Acytostelium subglobosum LB1]